MYQGQRITKSPFELDQLRRRDHDIFQDCLTLLEMHYFRRLRMDANYLVKDGDQVMQQLAQRYGYNLNE